MTLLRWRICTVAVLVPLSAAARVIPADAADTAASVPAAQYRSAFKNYRPIVDESESPDQRWRAANATVTVKPGEDGMGRHMGGLSPTEMPAFQATETTKPSGSTTAVLRNEHHKSVPSDKGVHVPRDKGVRMPLDKGMRMPDRGILRRQKNLKIPILKKRRLVPRLDMPRYDRNRWS
ncbi:MAG: hypothetical protein NVSMB6_25750 [Burkholderiaceae bacterium]